MAIIRCPACSHRMSSLAQSCPKCHAAVGELDQAEREKLAFRRWRSQLYRARNATYLAMTLVVAGIIWWWFAPPQGLALPAPIGAGFVLGIGLVAYVAGWAWLGWVKVYRRPERSGDSAN